MILTSSTNNTRKARKIYGIIGAILVLLMPCVIMHFNSSAHLETAQSLCPFKILTGFPCPGCGITKSIIFLYEGNLSKSLYYHLFGPFVVVLSLVTIIVLTTELITHKEYFQRILFSTKLAYFLGSTLATYHLIRLIYFVSTNSVDDILRQSIWK